MPGKVFVDNTYSINVTGHVGWVDTDSGQEWLLTDPGSMPAVLITVDLYLNLELVATKAVSHCFDFCIDAADTKDICQTVLSLHVSGLTQYQRTENLAPALFIDTFTIEDLSLIKLLGHHENSIVTNSVGSPTTFIGQDCCQTITYYTPIYHFLVKHHQLIDHDSR